MAFKDYIKGKKLVGEKTKLKTTYRGKPTGDLYTKIKMVEEFLNNLLRLNIKIR